MAVTILCPKLQCRAILQVPEGVRGKRVRCGECGAAFLVPAVSTPENKKKKSLEDALKKQTDKSLHHKPRS